MSKTLVNIRDDFLEETKQISGLSKKVDIVNQALFYFVRRKGVRDILKLKGQIQWEGDWHSWRKRHSVDLG